MRANRYVVAGTVFVVGAAGAIAVSTRGLVWADKCPSNHPLGYVLEGQNSQWEWFGFSWSQHAPNDHGETPKDGHTAFVVTAHKEQGHRKFTTVLGGSGGGWGESGGGPTVIDIWGNDESFKASLATPFFNGKKTLKASASSLGTVGGVEYFSGTVWAFETWKATILINPCGNFKIECGGGMAVRNDAYHDVSNGKSTGAVQRTRSEQYACAQIEGPLDGCQALCLEDKRGGHPKYEMDAEGEFVVDEYGNPQLDLDENGALQWHSLPQVTTRLTSTVESNGDGTITYLYVIENLTEDAIPFSVAQVPVSSTANGWSGTVSGNSSLQTSLTVGCGDYDMYVENACMELMVDGSTEFNESMGGQIYVPEHRREFTGTCVVTSITRTSLPVQNHVTILLAGGSAEDIYLFRQTATGADCVGEMHGSYVADETYTIDSEDAPSGTVSYYVSVGSGVNKYNSETAETINE